MTRILRLVTMAGSAMMVLICFIYVGCYQAAHIDATEMRVFVDTLPALPLGLIAAAICAYLYYMEVEE